MMAVRILAQSTQSAVVVQDAALTIHCFGGFDELPPSYDGLRAQLAQRGLFGEPEWFALLLHHTFDGAERMRLLAVEDGAAGRPLMLAVLRSTQRDHAAPGASVLAALSHPENYALLPLVFDPALAEPERAAAALWRALRRGLPALGDAAPDVLRLAPVEVGSALADVLQRSLRAAGWPAQPYANSQNYFEPTAGLSHAEYFGARSANLRYSVRRRRRALERSAALEFILVRDEQGLEPALADFVTVGRASWKEPKMIASIETLAMIRLAARRGVLRLGVLRLDGVAAAAQFWVVAAGTGYCLRLAHDERLRKQAVGVVLTDFMIGRLLDVDHVEAIDYGYGSDEYKAGWMKHSRVYIGVMAFNPDTWRGRWQALRHLGGQPVKRGARALLAAARPLLRPLRERWRRWRA